MEKAPDAFRTISEVADELEIPKHVLRFWEAKFAQLKPMKRGGGRRYYRPEDVALLRGIRFLLYNDAYTIRGVQKILREHGPRYVMDYRHLIDVAEDDQVELTDIPDIAAETAEGPGSNRHSARTLDGHTFGALLEEIEACHKILAEADVKD